MPIITYLDDTENDTLTLSFSGRIDSSNATLVEKEVTEALKESGSSKIVIDASELEYISSAGLRIVLRLRKRFPSLAITNVSTEVYEILDMTGFTEMVDVRKAYRTFSVEGCEVIGKGANGAVYRINADTILKVYKNPEALDEIKHERELARTAFVLGIPTAIPYDVVRVGDGYGSVFELLDAKSFAQLLISGEKTVDEIAEMSADLLKQIHGTVVKEDSMPDMHVKALGWVDYLEDYLPKDMTEKIRALIEAIPDTHTMLHGDFHIKNIMYQGGESLLIDMDTLCYGHPIFELGSIYNAYQGFSLTDHTKIERFLGIPFEMSTELWHKILEIYLGTDSEERLREVEDKAKVVGLTRLIRRAIRRGELETPEGSEKIAAYEEHLAEALAKVDTLVF